MQYRLPMSNEWLERAARYDIDTQIISAMAIYPGLQMTIGYHERTNGRNVWIIHITDTKSRLSECQGQNACLDNALIEAYIQMANQVNNWPQEKRGPKPGAAKPTEEQHGESI